RRHRRAPRAGRPASQRPGRPAGGGPPAQHRDHGEPQRRALRPASAHGHVRSAHRHARPGHPRLPRRRLRRGGRRHRARPPAVVRRRGRRRARCARRDPGRPSPPLPHAEPRLL
ncbi:MAG: Serine hydroxymethyltransferase, partial [uncultured Nocardioides sp.]